MSLICSFASDRSRPERIERWIAHLERLAEQNADEPQFVETIDILLLRARSWLPGAPQSTPSAAGSAGD